MSTEWNRSVERCTLSRQGHNLSAIGGVEENGMADLGAGFRRHPVRNGYLAVFGIVAIAVLVVGLVAPGSQAAALFRVFAFLAAIPAAFWSVRWLWRRLTYRVGVRFFVSYLLIGLTPFLLMAILAAIAGYILVGQYGSVRLGQDLDALGERLAARVAATVKNSTRRVGSPQARCSETRSGRLSRASPGSSHKARVCGAPKAAGSLPCRSGLPRATGAAWWWWERRSNWRRSSAAQMPSPRCWFRSMLRMRQGSRRRNGSSPGS